MKSALLEYRSILFYNREVFLIEHGDFLKTFDAIDHNFKLLVELPRTKRDANGKSHISLIPFLLLLQRQARSAFEALAANQAYQGWVLLRPGIEAVLIIGKWVDDPANAQVWLSRHEDPKAYRKVYTGKALQSKSLPRSERIQGVLSKINDDFVHANPDDYQRHLTIGSGDPGYTNVFLNFFDDDTVNMVHVLAFLHLILTVQDSLLTLFNYLFSADVKFAYPLDLFLETFGPQLKQMADSHEQYCGLLSNLGGWNAGR
jgi:hypothetical protein